MTSKFGPFPTEVVLVFECLVIQQVLYAVYTEQVSVFALSWLQQ